MSLQTKYANRTLLLRTLESTTHEQLPNFPFYHEPIENVIKVIRTPEHIYTKVLIASPPILKAYNSRMEE